MRITGIEETGGLVAVQADGVEHVGRLLVGADGVNSVVARSAGLLLERDVGTAIEAEVAVRPEVLKHQGGYATFDFGALPHGYGWIFPKKDHLSAGLFQARPGKARELRRRLSEFVERQPVLQGCRCLSMRGHRIPLGGRREKLHKGRVLLVGDAANLADPWLGEGVFYAILSAQVAAEVIHRFLAAMVADLGEYTSRINAHLVKEFVAARRLSRAAYSYPRMLSLAVARSSLLRGALFDLVRGDLTFSQLRSRLVRRFPWILGEVLMGDGMTPTGREAV